MSRSARDESKVTAFERIAWAARRAHGDKRQHTPGFAGYHNAETRALQLDGLARCIPVVLLWINGEISEGIAAKLTGLDRLSLRHMRDTLMADARTAVEPELRKIGRTLSENLLRSDIVNTADDLPHSEGK